MLCWYLKNSHLTNKPETNNALILPGPPPPPPPPLLSVLCLSGI